MSSRDAFIAANRFGYGPRPGDLARIGRDPRRWLRDQVSGPHRMPRALAGMPSSSETLSEFLRARRRGAGAIRKMLRRQYRGHVRVEIEARTRAMVASETPFQERLVAFWSNHFTVSAKRFIVGPVAGAYEREAIRPHIFGRFEDMLLAVARHPAMLMYLDNFVSIGPNSLAAGILRRGLNENLAREILELHTLGVNGGYSQADVVALAKILTGWSVGGIARRGPISGKFLYYPFAHEPGAKTLLGKTYGAGRAAGVREGADALRDLARHPSTARFVATKLVRHFVADKPPARAVAHIAKVFRDTGGDLRAVSRALIDLPEAWREPLAKVKTPQDFIVSALRAAALDRVPRKPLIGTYHTLRQMPFTAPSPAGWPDAAAHWVSPETLMRRIEWARLVARFLQRRVEPGQLLADTIGPVAHRDTRTLIDDAPSAEEGIALVLASAEFQRR